MPVRYVPSGEKTKINVNLRGGSPTESVEIKFFRKDKGSPAPEVGEGITTKLSGGSVDVEWTAAGLEKTELQARVMYTVTFGKDGGSPERGPDEFVVYRDTVDFTVVDEAKKPIANANYQFELEVNPQFRADTGADLEKVGGKRVCNSKGEAQLKGLPPGDLSIHLPTPLLLVRWEDFQADVGNRVVVVKPIEWKASFVSPAADRDQLVNLDADAAHPEQGVKVKVKVKGSTTGGDLPQGSKVYLQASLQKEGSPRFNADEGPALENLRIEPGKTAKLGKVLDAQGEVEFDLWLSQAGGNEFTLKVGATDACSDAELKLTTWRTIKIQPHHPTNFPLDLPDAVKPLVEGALEKVFVRVEWEAPTALDYLKGIVISSETRESWGKGTGRLLAFSPGNPQQAGGRMHDNVCRPDGNRLHCILSNLLYDMKMEPFKFKVKKGTTQTSWQKIGGGGIFAKPTPTGGEIVGNVRIDLTNSVVGIVDDQIELDKGGQGKKFRLIVPQALTDVIKQEKKAAEVTLQLQTMSRNAGSATYAWVTIDMTSDPAAKAASIARTIVHEFGHVAQLAPIAANKFPGFPLSKEEDELVHAHVYQGHEHQGPHCSHGLSKSNAAKADYHALTDKGTTGDCVMWGGTSDKVNDATLLDFCEICLPFAKGAPLGPHLGH
jgi:hypothetical protein